MIPSSSELIPIKSTTRTVQECFRTCLYIVPNFQRPYSWDKDELEDYWTDVVLARGDFFFGSTVTWESKTRELFNNSYSIIDGQQRLTTSAIILSVIRDFFNEFAKGVEEPGLAAQARSQVDNTQRYLIAVDDDGNSYPVIEREEPNFKEVVQNPSAIPSGKTWNGSATQIGFARAFFEAKVQEELAGGSQNDAIAELKKIRSNVLKARLIQVELGSEEDGFLIFETLNTRGADLRLADLVKNLLIRGGSTDADDRKTIADRWDRLADRIHSAGGSMTAVDQFMWQSWNSRRTAVTEAGLYKAISRRVKGDPAKHVSYLEELEFDSLAYQYFENVDSAIDRTALGQKSALKIPEIGDAFRALALFNVSVANSALLALVRTYETTGLLKKKDLIAACRAIENFHFQFTALKNSGSTGGTRGRYNRFAVELETAYSQAAVRQAIGSFKTKLKKSLPAPSEAEDAFAKLFYAPRSTLTNAQKRRSRKHFISYILLRIAQFAETLPPAQDLASWSIEHIRPQSKASEGLHSPEYSVGNLALLTSECNTGLGDGDLDSKRAGLERCAPWIDPELRGWIQDQSMTEVDATAIKKRARELASHAVRTVWAIN